MKKLMLIIGFLVTSISFGSENPSLKKEIRDKVNPDLSEIDLNQFNQDFVVVSFYIKDFQIKIIEIEGSQNTLIQLITDELTDMYIQKECSALDVYNYKFTFKKL